MIRVGGGEKGHFCSRLLENRRFLGSMKGVGVELIRYK